MKSKDYVFIFLKYYDSLGFGDIPIFFGIFGIRNMQTKSTPRIFKGMSRAWIIKLDNG